MYQASVSLQGQINALIKKYSDQKGKFAQPSEVWVLIRSRARTHERKLLEGNEAV